MHSLVHSFAPSLVRSLRQSLTHSLKGDCTMSARREQHYITARRIPRRCIQPWVTRSVSLDALFRRRASHFFPVDGIELRRERRRPDRPLAVGGVATVLRPTESQYGRRRTPLKSALIRQFCWVNTSSRDHQVTPPKATTFPLESTHRYIYICVCVCKYYVLMLLYVNYL